MCCNYLTQTRHRGPSTDLERTQALQVAPLRNIGLRQTQYTVETQKRNNGTGDRVIDYSKVFSLKYQKVCRACRAAVFFIDTITLANMHELKISYDEII